MCALMCRNVSALVCLLLIWNSKQQGSRSSITRLILDNKTANIVLLCIMLVSCALYSYQLFEYQIVTVINDRNETRWDIYQTKFGDSTLKNRFEIAATILRDCVNLLILVVLNFLIIYKLRLNLRKKKVIIKLGINEFASRSAGYSQNGPRQGTADEKLRSIRRKEKRQTVMVILTCSNYLLGRLPLLYLFVKRNLFIDTSNFGIYAILIAYLSYTANFLFYYVSNYRFRSSINKYFKNIFSIFAKLSCLKRNLLQ